jgi:hypothetical protein
MDLHQIEVRYLDEEDRLLCRTSFRDGANAGGVQEIRFWLTRRITRQLWRGITRSLQTQLLYDKPHASHASAEMIGMEHHASVAAIRDSGNFGSPFEASAQAFPFGAAPVMIVELRFTNAPGEPIRINFAKDEESGFEISFTQAMLHGFCSLLQEAVNKSEWDIDLTMPCGRAVPPGVGVLN